MNTRITQIVLALSMAGVLASAVHAQEGAVRPEVGKPLQAAADHLKRQQFKEALGKIREADGVGNKSASEVFTIERMRMSAAVGANDLDAAQKAFDVIGTSGKLPAADRMRMVESLASMAYKAGKYPAAIQWSQRYFRDGGTSSAMRTIQINSMYQSKDFAGVARELTSDITAAERAGTSPSEDRINMLMNVQLANKDMTGYVWSLEKMVTHFPKTEYWDNLLKRLQNKRNFSDRFALDTYRLSLVTGVMSKPSDYMEMAQLAVQAGYPAEGLAVMNQGYKSGVLGNGSEADRQKRLKDLIVKRAEEAMAGQPAALAEAEKARSGDALVNLGFAIVHQGEAKKGVELMQKGIAKGDLKRPEDAKLHLGIAQIKAGEMSKGLSTLKGVAGTDGSAELAHLWSVYARRR